MAVLAAIVVFSGCDASGPKTIQVHGRVTYQGKPVGQGWVTFLATAPSEGMPNRPARGELQPDGSYVLNTFQPGDGVVPGKYIVTVVAYDYSTWTPPTTPEEKPNYTTPEKYVRAETSDLRATVPADAKGPIELNFHLAE